MRISFMPAHAHLIFTCSCASDFCLRIRISFLPAHAHLIFTCYCASLFGLRVRIFFWLAHEDLRRTCSWCCQNSLLISADKTKILIIGVPQLLRRVPSVAISILGKGNNTCSCCARPGRLHWPVLNVWWTPNPNCRKMLMQISANK